MTSTLNDRYNAVLDARTAGNTVSAVELVDSVLEAARQSGASDVHLIPLESGLDVLWRIDGVLHPVTQLANNIATNVVARLKVLSGLLTYRNETPQEGRIQSPTNDDVEMRVSTFPTLFGEKAVIRLFAGSGRYQRLASLGLPADVRSGLGDVLMESGGVTLVCGPAGSGKTTTIYACLRELADKFGSQRSLVSLEDPIEAVIPGVAQSQINPTVGFDYETGLKSLMRQDPEVILVGEIRDRVAAETVFQAALTGHLVLTTFHAGSATGAICRLSDMGIEPYLLRTGLLGIVAQRLVRKLCECSRESSESESLLGLDMTSCRVPTGCEKCRGTGYYGRLLLAEFLRTESSEVGRAILSQSDSDELESLAVSAGMKTRWKRGLEAANSGETSPAELRRVFGFSG
ncbi:MAG: GspE/PulE family protein [Planctomycetota bacterium]|nr:GspE/PulE family protein [Planctomycetota bacterium]MDA1162783.1 GspE/PulE family protein [Planctomycetota bacterium]